MGKRRLKTALLIFHDLKEGLVTVGNTRFVTFYYAGKAVFISIDTIEQLI